MTQDRHSHSLIEEMNRYYDARAPWHDQYMDAHSPQQLAQRFSSVIDSIRPIVTGKTILDVACGTGNWTQLLAPMAASVRGLDRSDSCLQIARAKLPDYANVQFVQDDAYQLETLNDQFEVLFAADFWSHIPKSMIGPFLRNAAGRLKPGAAGIFLDMAWQSFFEEDPSQTDADGNRVFLRHLPDGSEFHVVKNFPTVLELRETIAPYGNAVRYIPFNDLNRWMVCFEFAA
jgi:2-polyprenyl-3-methyl-5-hydroxy-6-metoxy-1,4-benzoquinol methylase